MLVTVLLAGLLSALGSVVPQNIVGGGPMVQTDDAVGGEPMAHPNNIVGGGPMVQPPSP